MSYEIIYARQFVKAETEQGTQYIPFVLTGSNNCYERSLNGRERRARSWWNWRYYLGGNKHMGTLEDMLAVCENSLQDTVKNYEDSDIEEVKARYNNFLGIHNHVQKGETFDSWKRFFINGCKNAITVEQLAEVDEGIIVRTGYVFDNDKMKGKERFNKLVKTTQELLDTIEEAKEYHKDLDVGYELSLTLYNDKSAYTRIRRKLFPQSDRRNKERIETNVFYNIHVKGYGTFARKLKYGFKYGYGEDGGKRFLTRKEAEHKLKQLEKKIGYEMSVRKVELNYTVSI